MDSSVYNDTCWAIYKTKSSGVNGYKECADIMINSLIYYGVSSLISSLYSCMFMD